MVITEGSNEAESLPDMINMDHVVAKAVCKILCYKSKLCRSWMKMVVLYVRPRAQNLFNTLFWMRTLDEVCALMSASSKSSQNQTGERYSSVDHSHQVS